MAVAVIKALATKDIVGIQMPARRIGKKRDAQNQFVKAGGEMNKVAMRVMEETKEALKIAIPERKIKAEVRRCIDRRYVKQQPLQQPW